MATKIFLLVKEGPRRKCRVPYPEASHALAEGACPKCGVIGQVEKSFAVAGSGKYPSKDDLAWEAEAYCQACNQHVGVLRVETGTLFGVREDERVMRMGVKVY